MSGSLMMFLFSLACLLIMVGNGILNYLDDKPISDGLNGWLLAIASFFAFMAGVTAAN